MKIRQYVRTAGFAGIAVAMVAMSAACGESSSSTGDEDGWAPEREITVIVPAGPGGGSDQMARAATAVMEKIDPAAQFVVENVQGGGGAAGVAAYLKRPADGYTILQVPAVDIALLIHQGTINSSLDDFELLGRMQAGEALIAARSDNGKFDSYESMIDYMKSSGESLKAAMYIPEGFDDVTLRAIETKEGVEFTRVPYTDAGERFTAVLSGRADVILQRYGDIKQYLDSGDMFPVVSGFEDPPNELGDAPTLTSLDIDFPLDYSRGFWASSDIPDDAREYLVDLIAEAAESDEWVEPEQNRGYFDGYASPSTWREQLDAAMKLYDEAYG